MARKKRDLPEINAGSMADIAFLLLIFFLVSTTMDSSYGINRKLPAKPEQLETNPPPIHDRNIFLISINANDELLVEEAPMNIEDLAESAKAFVMNKGQRANLSDAPTKAFVSLKNHRLTSYEMYVAVQDALTKAYKDARNEEANEMFGKEFDDLNKEDQKKVKKAIPMAISEAEPIKE
ncbi:MAG: ExbD/TolR family protein [Flavobacteriales bacterium]